MSPRREDEPGIITKARPDTKPKLEKPKRYKVILHNDDFTPMEFVVMVLVEVFHKSTSDAMAIMLHAHTRGNAVAGVYTFEVAETKVQKTLELASQAQVPLLCTMEPE